MAGVSDNGVLYQGMKESDGNDAALEKSQHSEAQSEKAESEPEEEEEVERKPKKLKKGAFKSSKPHP